MSLVNNIINRTINNSSQISGRRNIPRYLYHITNKYNYESMLKEGYIKKGTDTFEESNLEGVFMFDLKNFTKRWCNSGFCFDDLVMSLAKTLILKTSNPTSDIVVLRIPTKKMPLEKLKCRAQNITENLSEEHALNGDFATRQKHFTRKKQPIEYIFQENIPMNSVEKIGEADTEVVFDNLTSYRNIFKLDVNQILLNLFKQQPEEKCIQLASNSSIKFQRFNPDLPEL